MRRHQRYAKLGRQLHAVFDKSVLIFKTSAMNLYRKTTGKRSRPKLCSAFSGRGLPVTQRKSGVTKPATGQTKNALSQRRVRDPFALDHRPTALLIVTKRARQPVTKFEVTAMRFREQNHARRLLRRINRLNPCVHAANWLDALGARGFVKLNEAKQIAQVGDRQRRLIVFCGQGYRVANTQGRVDNGELSVQAKVDERRGGHLPILRSGEVAIAQSVTTPARCHSQRDLSLSSARSCELEKNSTATAAPIPAINISFCVSHTSP